jgi:RHS repeat-associated protein
MVRNSSAVACRLGRSLSLFIAIALAPLSPIAWGANPESTMPKGMVGWWYYNGTLEQPSGYAASPEEACPLTARNHLSTDLLDMYPLDTATPHFDCVYRNPVGGRVWDYGMTHLRCQPGFTPQWPGVCVERPEISRPLACSRSEPGYANGNPVVVSSGAKVQSEIDLKAAPNGTLDVVRTYRTLRNTGGAQSAGLGWSFFFDRSFQVSTSPGETRPYKIIIVRGDGAYSEFNSKNAGPYVSRYERKEVLESLNNEYTDWLLTSAGGQMDRFRKVGDKFLLVSTHSKEGGVQSFEYGAGQQLASISDASGRTLRMKWDGKVLATVSSADEEVRYRYDFAARADDSQVPGTERLIGVDFFDAAGAPAGSRHYHYEHPNQRYLLTGITDEKGIRFATYAYNDAGQAVLSEHAGGANRHTFSYPSERKRIVTDPLGTKREFGLAYLSSDSPGRITSTNQPAGAGCGPASSAMTYDASGTLSSSTDFNGKKTCFVNDKTRGLQTSRVEGLASDTACPVSSTVQIPIGTRRISTQWHQHWDIPISIARPRQITTYVYNGERDLDGKIASCAGDAALPNGKAIAVLCSKTIQPTRDETGGQGFAAGTEGRSRTWRYIYNQDGQPIRFMGPEDFQGQAENVAYVYYDDTTASHTKGDLASRRNSVGETTEYLAYTANGLSMRTLRPDGVTVRLVYGARNRVVSQTLEGGSGEVEATSYFYSEAGQLERIKASDGSSYQFTYDDAQRLAQLSDSIGNQIRFTRNGLRNITRSETRNAVGELAGETILSFDALNRLDKIHRSAQSPATSYLYDRDGNLSTLQSSLGRNTSKKYDNFGRLVRDVLPIAAPGKLEAEVGYSYNLQDLLVSVSDPRKRVTRYNYDGFGQQIQLSSPDTGTTNFSYDDAGNKILSQDARRHATAIRYDAQGRPIAFGTNSYSYGTNGTSASGQIARMNDESGHTQFTYDGLGRLKRKTQTVGLGATKLDFDLSYEYGTSGTGTGHISAIIYPSGNRVAFEYGANGRPVSISLESANGTGRKYVLSQIDHRPFGPAYAWTWGNSTHEVSNVYTRTFDTLGRLKSYQIGHSAHQGTVRTLEYDEGGRIRSMSHQGQPKASVLDQRFFYDHLDRLIGVEATHLSQGFEYDSSGNRTQVRLGSTKYSNSISSTSNRLNKTGGPIPAKLNVYDSSGNLTSDGTINYTYGPNGRLTIAKVDGSQTSYFYNGLGERVAKIGQKDNSIYYVYDRDGHILGEYDSAGVPIQETIYLGDLPVAVLKPSARKERSAGESQFPELFYIYADHINTPRVITSAIDNRMVWRWDNVDPFGSQQPDESPEELPNFTYNLRFPGQVFDTETNNHYNYFRNYDPQIGRYIESDPIGLEGGLNTYAYVEANPVNKTDPLGLQSEGSLSPKPRPLPGPFDILFPGTPANNDFSNSAHRLINKIFPRAKPEEESGSCKLLVGVNHGQTCPGTYDLTCTYLCKDGSSFTINLNPWKSPDCPHYLAR